MQDVSPIKHSHGNVVGTEISFRKPLDHPHLHVVEEDSVGKHFEVHEHDHDHASEQDLINNDQLL